MEIELKELAEQLNTASAEIKNAQADMEKQIKANGEATTETKTALEEAEAKMSGLVEKFEAMDEKLAAVEVEQKRIQHGEHNERKTLGQLFTESDVFEEVKSNARGTNKPMEIQRKDITSVEASAGALIRPDRDPEVYRDPSRPMRIRDLIPSIPTQSGSVEVMRQNVFTNEAGPQQPSTPNANQGGGEFEAKNESAITWELVTYPIRTIAHWVPASRQALSDAPMLRGLIDTELTYGLDLESDQQLLLGDGTNQNLTGLLVDAGVSDVGEIVTGTSADDLPGAMIDHIRTAVTKCQTNEYYNVNGVVLNPNDWETLELAKATDGHYLMINLPADGAQERIWRMPVIITNAMPEGEFILGDWTLGAKIYDRESVSVRVSESHADYFVKNGVAILAEERYTMAVNRPKAFTKGSFEVASD